MVNLSASCPGNSAPGPSTRPIGPLPRPHHGLTLLELLVCMAILAVLATLILPALNRALEKARAIICLSNLRQWGLATQLYVVDHDDYLPPEGHPNPMHGSTNNGWYIQLPRQMGLPRYHEMPWRTNASVEVGSTIWLCPSNPRRSNGLNLFHYCLNEHVNGTGAQNRPIRMTSIPAPPLVVWLFDSKNLPAVGYWGFTHTNLHAGGANFSFLDGHAARFPNQAYWDAAANRGRTNHPALRWIP
jgi:prepilin-type N-terminal cleavage/methylation domain-containing protein/prepilin-type processing-associated H-X9-DG protein